MNSHKIIAFATIWLSAIGVCRAIGSTTLKSTVDSSDAVVIAVIEADAFDGSLHHVSLRIVRSLKGTLAQNSVINADFSPTGPRKAASVSGTTNGNVLLFLNQDGQGSWHLRPISPGLGLSAACFKVSDKAVGASPTAGTSGAVQIAAQIMASTVESDASQASSFLNIVPYTDAQEIFDTWSASPSSRLVAYALTAKISSAQDSSAVVGASGVVTSRADMLLISSAIRGYRNPDPKGVVAVGKIATAPGADPQISMNCAYALMAVHTRESVPYLVTLLDSPTPMVRQLALAGISAFVTNMRIAKDGIDSAEARDEVMNPGNRRNLPASDAPFETSVTRQYLHFGPFSSSADESSFIAFWKSWYQQNKSQF